MRGACITFLCLAFLPVISPAQTEHAAPPRPALPTGADTNSPGTYYAFGVARLRGHPDQAAAAFFWASRLDPETADYPYALWIARVIESPRMLRASRRVGDQAAAARTLDSLRTRALTLNPFLHRRLDYDLFVEMSVRASGGGAYAEQWASRLMQRHEIPRAVYDASHGAFDNALALMAVQAAQDTTDPYLRVERARMFYLRGSPDSARAMLREALGISRRAHADSLRFIYENTAAWHYSLGRVEEHLGHAEAAREAYQQAIVEDLSYWPAHIRLGALALAQGDTAEAGLEFVRALQVKEDEYVSHTTIAFLQAALGRLDSAAAHVRRAIELEPHAAVPRHMLAQLEDARGDTASAVAAYERFLERARRDDPDTGPVRARVRQLRGGVP